MIAITKEQALFLIDYESIGYYCDGIFCCRAKDDVEIVVLQDAEKYFMCDIEEIKNKRG